MNNLKHLVYAAHELAKHPEIIQGSGGNISIKTDNRRLIIKGSGVSFHDVQLNNGLVELSEQFVQYYQKELMEDSLTLPQDKLLISLKGKRPSMESGFHAVLEEKAIIHTHPLWTNAFACTSKGEQFTKEIFGEDAAWVGYRMPGHDLALEIKKVVLNYEKKRAKIPSLFILENHGLIVTAPTVKLCLENHAFAIDKAKKFLQTRIGSLPSWPHTDWERSGDFLIAKNSVIAPYTRTQQEGNILLTRHPFPDAYVFFQKALFIDSPFRKIQSSVAMLKDTGIMYGLGEKYAKEYDEIITASALVRELAIRLAGEVQFLSAESIENLRVSEEERYRRALKS